jgi:hypothetical protein
MSKRTRQSPPATKAKAAGRAAKTGLRFDKVALRLIRGLQAELDEVVPEEQTVIVTVTAPIRLPAKTAALLDELIRKRLARRSAGADIKDTIHGNGVRIRFVNGVAGRAPKVIGFVHNSGTDADILLAVTQSLLRQFGATLT